jgi:formamidopyrimidine-DNA glycosylase
VRLPKLLRFSPTPTLESLIARTVTGARRRAKILLIDFDRDLTLAIHFKLAGQLAVIDPNGTRHVAGHPVPSPEGPYPHKSTHVEIGFDDGTILYLSDIRQFGWLRLLPAGEVDAMLASLSLGPEATGSDGMDAAELGRRLSRRSIAVKLALLNQKVIAGIGNIYVDEALHHGRIHPATPANALDPASVGRLWNSIVWALERGLEQGGAKIVHSVAYPVDGFPAVHGRKGKPCPTCGTPVEKIRVGARGTYLCPVCQPAPATFTMKSQHRRSRNPSPTG